MTAVDAARQQRPQHAAARHQRDLALGAGAAHQHGDLAQRDSVHSAHSAPPRLKATTLAGTAPIEPAPMAITTSPPRAN